VRNLLVTSTDLFPVHVFGGPTALFEYGGLRFLTDPTFDAPGDYPADGGPVLTKTATTRSRSLRISPT
jgi:hypothetical protein